MAVCSTRTTSGLRCGPRTSVGRSRRKSNAIRCLAGFTLAESLLAAVLLAAAVAAVSVALAASSQQQRTMPGNVTMVQLARQLMEEVIAKPFGDPDRAPPGDTSSGPDEASRAQYDDIGDYHGYSDSSQALSSADGSAVPDNGGGTYTRSVSVEFRSGPAGPVSAGGDLALVTVTVSSADGRQIQLSRLVARVTMVH